MAGGDSGGKSRRSESQRIQLTSLGTRAMHAKEDD